MAQKYFPSMKIAQRRGRWFLSINGLYKPVTPKEGELAHCLIDSLGQVVPYARLCLAIGHKSAQRKQRHVLRQHMVQLNRILTAPYAVAVARNVGYALCKISS
jgi:DNA-binding response OmpR family regulator